MPMRASAPGATALYLTSGMSSAAAIIKPERSAM
jgi:hypothetical protein